MLSQAVPVVMLRDGVQLWGQSGALQSDGVSQRTVRKSMIRNGKDKMAKSQYLQAAVFSSVNSIKGCLPQLRKYHSLFTVGKVIVAQYAIFPLQKGGSLLKTHS